MQLHTLTEQIIFVIGFVKKDLPRTFNLPTDESYFQIGKSYWLEIWSTQSTIIA